MLLPRSGARKRASKMGVKLLEARSSPVPHAALHRIHKSRNISASPYGPSICKGCGATRCAAAPSDPARLQFSVLHPSLSCIKWPVGKIVTSQLCWPLPQHSCLERPWTRVGPCVGHDVRTWALPGQQSTIGRPAIGQMGAILTLSIRHITQSSIRPAPQSGSCCYYL